MGILLMLERFSNSELCFSIVCKAMTAISNGYRGRGCNLSPGEQSLLLLHKGVSKEQFLNCIQYFPWFVSFGVFFSTIWFGSFLKQDRCADLVNEH